MKRLLVVWEKLCIMRSKYCKSSGETTGVKEFREGNKDKGDVIVSNWLYIIL